MKIKKNADCDILVIGAGLAGYIAAARASDLGLKTIQAGNSSSLFFASGLFDLLGVFPADSGKILTKPYSAIKKLQSDQPYHPYSKVSQNQIQESFQFLTDFLSSAGLNYQLSGPDNKLVLTSVGTFKPTYMVPETFSKGCDLHKDEKNLLIVDFKGLRGFSARQAAAGLVKKNRATYTLSIELPENSGNLNPVHLAKSFEKKEFIQRLADKILGFSGKADIVGLPAICGIHNSLDIVKSLEKKTGMDIFEIPGMPPSIPGLRLKNAFEKKLSTLHVNFLSNAKIVFHAMEKDHFILQAINDNFETRIKARGVILASGRFPGGGLFARRDIILETVFDLPVFQPETRDLWHQLNFFDAKGHQINQAGLETDDTFRPLDKTGKPVFENLYSAGSIIAHNDWARLKSGTGVSCVSAYTAVNSFYKKNM
ncbi:glycerol-3-phosphate dehydrogenase subunit GlpB [Desulfobacula sp.]|uniref:glycerol-3-phosphate dehydrogenase subunit GlpB n=1 Tax=Desulfobacula sp. TaxID=2593537 RepID=UPI001EC6A6B5|nr:glycerol-3-phosphate dehydrogenase subunit GlpB [Desulfobacula sp.]